MSCCKTTQQPSTEAPTPQQTSQEATSRLDSTSGRAERVKKSLCDMDDCCPDGCLEGQTCPCPCDMTAPVKLERTKKAEAESQVDPCCPPDCCPDGEPCPCDEIEGIVADNSGLKLAEEVEIVYKATDASKMADCCPEGCLEPCPCPCEETASATQALVEMADLSRLRDYCAAGFCGYC